ncbi:MAG: MFS transporter [Acidobacteriota bacterium]|nr:MFS transporter [Acidobacteriota bacterium]
MVFLDSTVVNVALPAIQRELGASLADQQWIVEAYLVTLGSLMLIGGSLDDLFERRTVFVAGVSGFGICSALCALAPNATFLIGVRALQGMAGALLVPGTLAIIMATFPERERGGAIGTWTAWTGVATVIGPLAGGALIESSSWRLIFVLNLPLAALTLGIAARFMARSGEGRHGARLDLPGAALCALGLGGMVLALIEQPRVGWGSGIVLGAGLGGLAALVLFVARERRTAAPMLPLSLFGARNFAVGNAATLTMYAGLGGALFFINIFLQQVAGYTPLEAGAAFLPVTALMFALSRRTGALAGRYGPRLFMGLGPLVAGAGLALMARIDVGATYPTRVAPALALFGLGLSITVAPLTAAVLGAVDVRHSGVASGVNNAIARVGGLIAIAALGAVVAGRYAALVGGRLSALHLGHATGALLTAARSRPLSLTPAERLAGPARDAVHAALAASSLSAFRLGILVTAALVAFGGVISLVGIGTPAAPPAGEGAAKP